MLLQLEIFKEVAGIYISRINQRIIRAEAAPPSGMGGSGILDVKNKAIGSRIYTLAVYRGVAWLLLKDNNTGIRNAIPLVGFTPKDKSWRLQAVAFLVVGIFLNVDSTMTLFLDGSFT